MSQKQANSSSAKINSGRTTANNMLVDAIQVRQEHFIPHVRHQTRSGEPANDLRRIVAQMMSKQSITPHPHESKPKDAFWSSAESTLQAG